MHIKTNTPVWFRALPKQGDARPNALFLRELGVLNGEIVCEIFYRNDKWLTRRTDFFLHQDALIKRAALWKKEIDAAPEQDTHKALKISKAALKRRQKFIEQFHKN